MTSFQISKWGGSIVDIFRNAEWMELNFIFPYSIDFICLGFLFRESVHTREWAHVHEGGRGRGRGSPADSKLSAEPKAGLIPTTPKSWPKSKSRGGHSTDGATQEPFSTLLNEFLFWRTRMPEPTFDGLWCQLPVVNSAFFFFFFTVLGLIYFIPLNRTKVDAGVLCISFMAPGVSLCLVWAPLKALPNSLAPCFRVL